MTSVNTDVASVVTGGSRVDRSAVRACSQGWAGLCAKLPHGRSGSMRQVVPISTPPGASPRPARRYGDRGRLSSRFAPTDGLADQRLGSEAGMSAPKARATIHGERVDRMLRSTCWGQSSACRECGATSFDRHGGTRIDRAGLLRCESTRPPLVNTSTTPPRGADGPLWVVGISPRRGVSPTRVILGQRSSGRSARHRQHDSGGQSIASRGCRPPLQMGRAGGRRTTVEAAVVWMSGPSLRLQRQHCDSAGGRLGGVPRQMNALRSIPFRVR